MNAKKKTVVKSEKTKPKRGTVKVAGPRPASSTKSARLKQTTDVLKASEIRYRRLFESAQDGILILDARTGMIEDVNPFLIKMLGYSHAEFIKKKLWEVGAFKDVAASKEAFETLQAQEYIRYEDLPLKTKDGRLIQVEFVSNVYLAGGEKVIQCNIRDTTQHRRIIAAMRENERKYRALVIQNPDGIFLIDLSGNFLSANQAMCEELGFSEEELRSMKIWDIIPDQYIDQYKARLGRILNGETLLEPSEYVVRGKDGKNFSIEIISAPYYGDEGIIGFQGIAHDITERKQAADKLRESEERYRSLTELSPDAIAIHQDGKFVYVNGAGVKLLGARDLGELVGMSVLDIVHPDSLESVIQRLRQMTGGQAVPPVEEKFIQLDGTPIDVDVAAMPFLYQGQPAIQVVVRDITERKQAESQLNEQFAELQRWNAAMLGRESRLLEVKHEVNELLAQAGQPPRYTSAET